MLLNEQKQEVIKNFRRSELDTGSSEVQIALLTYRIVDLTEHFKKHKKDHHGRLGLVKMVNKRRKLLDYLKRKNFDSYTKLIAELDIRK
ncbi:MAG: 30S ribosomal protein S15 [Bdellovibrionales bacterium]|nr:30S ribosomal protein S15 [Bdellovibrionales bacterium]